MMVNYWCEQPNWKVFWYTLQPVKRQRMAQRIKSRIRSTHAAWYWREYIKPRLINWVFVPNAEGHLAGYHSDVKVDCWVL